MQRCLPLVLLASVLWRLASAGYAVVDLAADVNPVKKVVTLLEDMKAQVANDAEEDHEATDKYNCWCEKNGKQNVEAVETAQKQITELEAFIEQAAGLEGQLKTEISTLEADIAAGQESLDKAVKLKESETAEFQAQEKDLKETVEAISKALEVLAKVQLLQRQGGSAAAPAEARPLLLQLKGVVKGLHARLGGGEFRSVMQQDLWDVMSSIDSAAGGAEFLSGGRSLSTLEEHGRLSSLQPTDLEGNTAGASSYNVRSGSIYGMLSEMKDDFERSLKTAQKQDLESMILFQKLRSSKLAEITAATTSKEEKERTLADTMAKAAQAEQDVEATKDALSADQQFLLTLKKSCKDNEEEYAKRSAARSEELQALSEAVSVLTTDDARDLYAKTMSFLQVRSTRHRSVGAHKGAAAQKGTDAARNQAVTLAMKHILRAARKHSNWVLASLAVRVRLDPFTKVKEVMDKMLAELKAQQKAESQKRSFCNTEIDSTEDTIKTKEQEKEDLEGKKLGLENSIASLESEIEELKTQVAAMQVSLKQAGEGRKKENMVFQQSVSDQRATINILQKARARLAKYYSQASLVQRGSHQEPSTSVAPGAAVEQEPEKSKAYEKSAGAGGVLQLLDMITQDAKRAESELISAEQYAQEDYMSLVKDSNAAIEADNTALVEKTKLKEQTVADKSEADGSLLANGEELQKLGEVVKGMHLDCDYLLKYYKVRQEARAEEMNSIVEAKAILSGADFGKEDSA
mmetsp:Transcript_88688/g.228737  ORF Transcript_88688/g.228737 Transcript_88688/m.228737 type:complete len:747 (-) Transcript_88688:88-2328(-)